MPIVEQTCYRVACDGANCDATAVGLYEWYETREDAIDCAWISGWREVVGTDGYRRWLCPGCHGEQEEE